MTSFPLEARTNFTMMNITLLLTMSIASVSSPKKLLKEEFMKEKVESMKKLLDMDDVEIVAERLKRMMMQDSNPTPSIFNDVVTLLSLIDELKRKNEFYN
jgi:hypothetical protein